MPFDFYIDAGRQLVFSRGTGEFTRADAALHMKELSAHPDFRREFNQLVDFQLVTKVVLSKEDIMDLAKKAVFSATSRRAFVVSSDLQFGLSRMFATHRELAGEKGIMIFREMTAALAWLSISEGPDPGKFARLKEPKP